MNELLEMEDAEMEVLDEYGEVIYSGEFDEYLAINNYDEELEEVLNNIQNTNIKQWKYTNEDGEMLIIREVV